MSGLLPMYQPPVQALVVQQRQTAREVTDCARLSGSWIVSHGEAIQANSCLWLCFVWETVEATTGSQPIR